MKYREIEHLYESEKRLKLKFDGIYFNTSEPESEICAQYLFA